MPATASTIPREGPFNLTYNVPLMDIGSGYAQGIREAGQSIAGAIQGTAAHVGGILEQNATTNDMLTQLTQTKGPDGNPILSKDEYESIMGKSLGAKHQFLGGLMTKWESEYKSHLEQQRQFGLEHLRQSGQMAELSARAGYEKELKQTPTGDERFLTVGGKPAPPSAPESATPQPQPIWTPGQSLTPAPPPPPVKIPLAPPKDPARVEYERVLAEKQRRDALRKGG